jgi:HK97 family phage prohead protease
METKYVGGRIIETKAEERRGVPVGILAGYLATWDVDTGMGARYGIPEQFVKGAFLNSIAEHKSRNNRQVRLKDFHGRVIGGFPIDTVREDGTGLFGRGEVNLDTQLGAEAFALAKQGVLVDFSLGFQAVEDKVGTDIRTIYEALIFEASVVDEPMNRNAQITEVKGAAVARYANLDVAPLTYQWDAEAAAQRIGDLKFSVADGNAAYLCENKTLLFADVIEDKLMAVPQALEQIVAELKSSNENLPASMMQQLEQYYLKMGRPSPFETQHFFDIEEVKSWDVRSFEKALLDTGAFSKGAAKLCAAHFEKKRAEPDDSKGLVSLLSDIQSITKEFKGAA